MCAADDFLIEAYQSRDSQIRFGSAKSEVIHIFIRWFSRQNRIWKQRLVEEEAWIWEETAQPQRWSVDPNCYLIKLGVRCETWALVDYRGAEERSFVLDEKFRLLAGDLMTSALYYYIIQKVQQHFIVRSRSPGWRGWCGASTPASPPHPPPPTHQWNQG